MERIETAWNQYLGTCAKCGKFAALGNITDLCAECSAEDKDEAVDEVTRVIDDFRDEK